MNGGELQNSARRVARTAAIVAAACFAWIACNGTSSPSSNSNGSCPGGLVRRDVNGTSTCLCPVGQALTWTGGGSNDRFCVACGTMSDTQEAQIEAELSAEFTSGHPDFPSCGPGRIIVLRPSDAGFCDPLGDPEDGISCSRRFSCSACPSGPPADAGGPDSGTPDTGTSDGAMADSATSDAPPDAPSSDGGNDGCSGKLCNGQCTDTMNDPMNCGDCGIVCKSGSCSMGMCGM
jgi:hypothetical protein